jgi:hypothetical protein
METTKTLQLMDFFVEYIERRKNYEKAKVQAFTEGSTSSPPSVPSVSDRAAYKEFVDAVNAEVDAELAECFGFSGKPRRLIETEAVVQQAETVYRSMRAESLRTMPFSRRVAAAVGRRHGHSKDNGLIDKIIVDAIEKKITKGVSSK